MPGAIATLPRLKFTDLSGGPLASGTLTTYLSGSTTKTPTWQDQALTILNTNPIVLDANGSCIVWLDNTKAYKIVLADKNGVVQWTQSNVVGGGVDTSVVLNAALIQSAVDASAVSANASEASRQAVDSRFYPGIYTVAPTTRPNASARQEGDQYSSATQSYIFRSGAWVNYEATAISKAAEAATSAGTASTQAGLAVVAKVQAETARDAAAVAGKVYIDTPTGLAATSGTGSTNRYFSTPSPDSAELLILWLNNASVAVEQKRYPSAVVTSQLLGIAPTGYAWSVGDKDGVTAVGIKDDGTLAVKAAEIETLTAVNLSANALGVTGGDALQAGAPTGFVSAPVDQYGMSPGGWKADGTWAVAALEAQTLNGQPTALLPSSRFKGNYVTDIVHLISYGQSLSVGNGGGPLQTDMPLFDSLMFTAGVRAQDGTGTVAENHAALIPLVSATTAANGNGETPAGNAAATIKRLILAENSLAYTDQQYQILVSAPGVGNTAIAGLVKGQVAYGNLIADVTYGYALAQAAGKSYSVPTVCWSQGESDYALGTTYATYLAAILQLYTDMNNDIKAITNQSFDIKLIMYQCNVKMLASPATVGLAQLQASKVNANILISGPTYSLPHLTVGNLHLTGPGYAILGAHYGLVHKRAVIDGAAWKPLMPLSTQRQGNIVTAQFSVPALPLRLDSVALPAVANSGFTLVDNTGTAIVITSVTVTGPATVRIIAAAAVPAGSKLRYGYSAGETPESSFGGNLRDSQGDTLSAAIKVTAPLYNWCICFEETLA